MGINGETAGAVGVVFGGPATNLTEGAEFFVPIPNNGSYIVGGGPSYNDFKRNAILPVKIKGGQPLQMRMIGYTAEQPQCVMTVMQLRRLTPVECERLQGFPDNYTNIPWRKKPESPDGPRYKALGNSMAVPVMRWIGERIDKLTQL